MLWAAACHLSSLHSSLSLLSLLSPRLPLPLRIVRVSVSTPTARTSHTLPPLVSSLPLNAPQELRSRLAAAPPTEPHRVPHAAPFFPPPSELLCPVFHSTRAHQQTRLHVCICLGVSPTHRRDFVFFDNAQCLFFSFLFTFTPFFCVCVSPVFCFRVLAARFLPPRTSSPSPRLSFSPVVPRLRRHHRRTSCVSVCLCVYARACVCVYGCA